MKREFHLNKESTKTDIEISYDSSSREAVLKIPRNAKSFRIQRGNTTNAIYISRQATRANSSWAQDLRFAWSSWIILEGNPGSSNFWTKRGDFSANGFGHFGSSVSIDAGLNITSNATMNGLSVTSNATIAKLTASTLYILKDGSALAVSVGANDSGGAGYKAVLVPNT